MRIKRLLLLLALVFMGSHDAKATHIMGGEIVWECLPTGQYRFTLVLYRDCCSTCATISTSPQTLANNAGVSVVCNYVSTTNVEPVAYESTCTPSCGGTSGSGAMQKYVFQSNPITLTGTPPASGWYFTWSSCCRPSSISNGPANGQYLLRGVMYPYTPPGSTSALSAGTSGNPTCYDSSPNFLEDPSVVACTGNDITYNNLGYDPDLDSLYYDWAPPLGGTSWPGTAVSFSSGYSYTSPLPSGAGSTGATIDGTTGEIAFNAGLAGSWATCVKIEEWRCGQLVGQIFRDIPIVTLSCTPNTGFCASTYVDQPPSLSLTTDSSLMNPTVLTPVTNAGGDTLYFTTDVYPGDTVRFKITSTDPYPNPDCSPQVITLNASGGNLSSAAAYNNPNNCLFNPPCATLTSLNAASNIVGGNPFASKGINDVRFNWHIDCNHLFYQEYQCGTLKSEYEFYIRMVDDQCPVPQFTYKKVLVKVKNYMPGMVDLTNSCIQPDPVTGAVTFDWATNVDTGFNFDYYLINHIDPSGNLTTLDTIYDWSVNSFTHNNPLPNAVNSYTIQVAGGCGLLSNHSDTLQTVQLDLQATPPPPNSSIALLSWNPWKASDTSTYYSIWVEAPINSGQWNLLDSTKDFSYNDTVAYCGEWLKYQVRYHNSCGSSLDSGFFSDKTAPAAVVFDSVSVDATNLAEVAWQPSTDGDVVYYVIYREDVSGFLQPIDSVTVDEYPTTMPYIYATSNAANQSEKFVVTAVDSCGNQSSVGNTVPNSTIHLIVGVDPCDGFARLRWNTYKTWLNTEVLSYNLYCDITDLNGSVTPRVLLQGGSLDTTFRHYGIINGYQYCYYVQAVDTTGTLSSTSNKVCNSSAVVQNSRVLYLGRADVTSQGGVDLYAYIDKDADVIDFNIQRADDEIGPYMTIGNVVKPTLGPWEVKFVDYTADPSGRRYFYRISSRDSCGAIDTISNLATNMLLDVTAVGNLTNRLVWSAYREYADGVETYQIFRSADGGSTFTLASETSDTAFVDDIKPFVNSKGKFCYYIKAIAKDGVIPWRDEFGQKFNSRSNVACAVHKARIWIPSAFNPESSVAANQKWRPTNVFALDNSYTLRITDRWGNTVFETTDLKEAWDGTVNGRPAPIGVYNYYLKYRSMEDVPVEERGSFSLIR